MITLGHHPDPLHDSMLAMAAELRDIATANVRQPAICDLCTPIVPCWYCDANWNARVGAAL